jgi:hypothetical protein
MRHGCRTHRAKVVKNLPASGPMPVQPCVLSQTIWGRDDVIAEMLASVMLVQLEMFRLEGRRSAKERR